jgi:hypothetical protein
MANNAMRSKAGMKAAKKSNATGAQKDNAKFLKSSVKMAKKVGKDIGFAGSKQVQGKTSPKAGVFNVKAGNEVVRAKSNFERGNTKSGMAASKKIESARVGAAQKVQRKLTSKGK